MSYVLTALFIIVPYLITASLGIWMLRDMAAWEDVPKNKVPALAAVVASILVSPAAVVFAHNVLVLPFGISLFFSGPATPWNVGVATLTFIGTFAYRTWRMRSNHSFERTARKGRVS